MSVRLAVCPVSANLTRNQEKLYISSEASERLPVSRVRVTLQLVLGSKGQGEAQAA